MISGYYWILMGDINMAFMCIHGFINQLKMVIVWDSQAVLKRKSTRNHYFCSTIVSCKLSQHPNLNTGIFTRLGFSPWVLDGYDQGVLPHRQVIWGIQQRKPAKLGGIVFFGGVIGIFFCGLFNEHLMHGVLAQFPNIWTLGYAKKTW